MNKNKSFYLLVLGTIIIAFVLGIPLLGRSLGLQQVRLPQSEYAQQCLSSSFYTVNQPSGYTFSKNCAVVNAQIYQNDSRYTFFNIPVGQSNSSYIQTPNVGIKEDLNLTWSVDITAPSTIYLLTRKIPSVTAPLPAWITNEYTKITPNEFTGTNLNTYLLRKNNDGLLGVYDIWIRSGGPSTGHVTFSAASTPNNVAYSMYIVMLKPILQVTPIPTTSATPIDTSLPTASPTPRPSSGSSDPIIAAAGDLVPAVCTPASCGAAYLTSNLIFNQLKPSAVLLLGDIQYENGSLSLFNASFLPSWGRFNNITYPAPGNHEYGTPGASGYFQYYATNGNQTVKSKLDPQKGYYSYDIGTWHMISLNSNCAAAGGCNAQSPQYAWLENDLKTHPNKCTLAYWHHPRYSSGHDGNNIPLISQYIPFWNVLHANKADVILNGHSHNYERFAPQDGQSNSVPTGIREFVVGTGGKNFTGWWTATPIKNSEIRDNTHFGVLKMALHPTSYDWEFLPVTGSAGFIDKGTSACN
ncbi:MAG: metallophosphoesterase [bacterium]|nr:metallophosphoesterase [bacterium]